MQISADIKNVLGGGTSLEDQKITWNWTYTVDQANSSRELTEEELDEIHERAWREIEKTLKNDYERNCRNS